MNISKVLGLAAVLTAVTVSPMLAHQIKTKTLIIMHPWVHAADKGAAATDGFLVIHNIGKEPERLLSAVIDGVGEASVMQPAADKAGGFCKLSKGIEIAPGATVELKPGQAGLRFGAVDTILTEESYANGVLNFAKEGAAKMEFYVAAAGAKTSGHVMLADCAVAPPTQ